MWEWRNDESASSPAAAPAIAFGLDKNLSAGSAVFVSGKNMLKNLISHS
jgi:hypothetical protein